MLFHLLKNYQHLKITSLSFSSPLFPHPKYLNPLHHNNHTADWQDLPAILGTWIDLFLLWQHRQLNPASHAPQNTLSWRLPRAPFKHAHSDRRLWRPCSPSAFLLCPLQVAPPAETRSWSLGPSSVPVETQLILFIQRDLSSSVSKADKSRVRIEIFQVLSYPKNTQLGPGMTIVPLALLFYHQLLWRGTRVHLSSTKSTFWSIPGVGMGWTRHKGEEEGHVQRVFPIKPLTTSRTFLETLQVEDPGHPLSLSALSHHTLGGVGEKLKPRILKLPVYLPLILCSYLCGKHVHPHSQDD